LSLLLLSAPRVALVLTIVLASITVMAPRSGANHQFQPETHVLVMNFIHVNVVLDLIVISLMEPVNLQKTTVTRVYMTIHVQLATVIMEQAHVDTQTYLSVGNFMF
jgi:hypothetical protein